MGEHGEVGDAAVDLGGVAADDGDAGSGLDEGAGEERVLPEGRAADEDPTEYTRSSRPPGP